MIEDGEEDNDSKERMLFLRQSTTAKLKTLNSNNQLAVIAAAEASCKNQKNVSTVLVAAAWQVLERMVTCIAVHGIGMWWLWQWLFGSDGC